MKVYITPKNPIDSDIDELTLMPEDDIDRQKCQTILDKYETSGCGFSVYGQLIHVSIKLTEKQKDA